MLFSIENMEFKSDLVKKNSNYIYEELKGLISTVNEYVSCVVRVASSTTAFSNMHARASSFACGYSQIKSDYDTILIAESELLEKTVKKIGLARERMEEQKLEDR